MTPLHAGGVVAQSRGRPVVDATIRRCVAVACWATVGLSPALRAQDTIPPAERGVRIGITYTPGMRPGLLVIGGPIDEFRDSVRTILRRDLEFSDRYEMISLPGGDTLLLGIAGLGGASGNGVPPAPGALFVNYPLYAALGAEYSVALLPGSDSATVGVTLFDVRGETARRRWSMPVLEVRDPQFRMSVHRIADEIVRATTGEAGIAATRLAFISGRRLYRVDADGAATAAVSPQDVRAFSPAWDPSGLRVAYTELYDGLGRIVVHDLERGTRRVIDATQQAMNYTAAFAPDGDQLVFSRSDAEGTDLYVYNLLRNCCLQRLTVGRFSDNLSPTFSPDGRRIAFVSTRAGLPQIYVMARDGTGQELFAPFDYGVTGSSNAPEWSPDGRQLAFHRDVLGSPQVFVMDVRSRVVRQLTSFGRNEDPTWAPDGRHVAFVSNRTGTRQVWVIDVETGRVRQLTTMGETRLPAWSLRVAEPTQAAAQP